MAKDALELEGKVSEQYPGTKYRVTVDLNGTAHDVLCTIGGKLRMNKISIIVGDKVTIELSPYDLSRGRIVWRNK